MLPKIQSFWFTTCKIPTWARRFLKIPACSPTNVLHLGMTAWQKIEKTKAQKRESSETSRGLAVKFPRRLKLVGIGRHAFLWFTSELFCPKGIKHKSTFATACLHITEQHRGRFEYVCQSLQLYLGPNVDARELFRTDTVNLVSTCCHSTRR